MAKTTNLKNICPTCRGSGHDKNHKWPDGSFASCEACEGYGYIGQPTAQQFNFTEQEKEAASIIDQLTPIFMQRKDNYVSPQIFKDLTLRLAELLNGNNKAGTLLRSIVNDVEEMRTEGDETLPDREHWFGSFGYAWETAKGTDIQWPNLSILINQAKELLQ